MDLPPALWLCGKKGNVTLITVFQKGMLEINVFFLIVASDCLSEEYIHCR